MSIYVLDFLAAVAIQATKRNQHSQSRSVRAVQPAACCTRLLRAQHVTVCALTLAGLGPDCWVGAAAGIALLLPPLAALSCTRGQFAHSVKLPKCKRATAAQHSLSMPCQAHAHWSHACRPAGCPAKGMRTGHTRTAQRVPSKAQKSALGTCQHKHMP